MNVFFVARLALRRRARFASARSGAQAASVYITLRFPFAKHASAPKYPTSAQPSRVLMQQAKSPAPRCLATTPRRTFRALSETAATPPT